MSVKWLSIAEEGNTVVIEPRLTDDTSAIYIAMVAFFPANANLQYLPERMLYYSFFLHCIYTKMELRAPILEKNMNPEYVL